MQNAEALLQEAYVALREWPFYPYVEKLRERIAKELHFFVNDNECRDQLASFNLQMDEMCCIKDSGKRQHAVIEFILRIREFINKVKLSQDTKMLSGIEANYWLEKLDTLNRQVGRDLLGVDLDHLKRSGA